MVNTRFLAASGGESIGTLKIPPGLAFRIPTPLFGLGLIDSIPDLEIRAHLVENAARKAQLGIHGTPNMSGNENTIARFGWKAQNKSLVIFASALKSLELVVQRLRETHWLEVPEEDRGALEDTLIEIRQALEIVNLERETLAVTMDAFASVISNNLNDVMKLLAAVTVILTPPLAVAGYWGMNVPVPWSGQPCTPGSTNAR